MEELGHILSNLSLTDNKERVLGEIKPALSSLTRAEISSGLRNVDLICLFDCLNTEKTSQIEICCDILQHLLSFLDPLIILQKYECLLIRGMSHRNSKVPVIIVQQLHRCARDDELAQVIGNHEILYSALELLNRELTVSKEVITFLVLVSESKPGLEILTRNRFTSKLQDLMTSDDMVKIRVMELTVKICQLSQDHLNVVERAGLLQPLLNLIYTEDVLVKLNAVDLLSDLALTHQGLRFLEAKGILSKMEDILKECKSDPFADILLPGLVKFFGNIAHLRPKEMILQHPTFVDAILEMTESDALTNRVISFETIGFIGSSLEGKSALVNLGNKMTNCIEKFADLVQDTSTEIRIRGLNAFASLIKLDKENQSQQFLSITEAWFRRALGNSPTSLLYSLVKQPFPDIRAAVYHVLINVAKQGWGRREILRFPGFPELLLDRSIERDKLGKENKYELIKCLVENGDSCEIVGQDLDIHLREYIRQGPFYVSVQSEVAFEESN